MGKPKEGMKEDKTSELLSESAALKLACDYCKRGEKREGLPAGVEFRGGVVKRFIGDPEGTVPVPGNIPYRRIGGRRPPRVKGTTKWLYYIEPDTCEVFHVDTISRKHYKGQPLWVQSRSTVRAPDKSVVSSLGGKAELRHGAH